MSRVLFLYPTCKNMPNGGLKVIYDYSNRLAEDNHEITIAYASFLRSSGTTFKQKLKAVAKYIYSRIIFHQGGYSWYPKHRNIREVFVWDFDFNRIPHADTYIATAVNTAFYVADFPVDIANKFYFIQGYESFIVDDDEYIRSTYRLPLRKIAISQWLSRLVAEEGQGCKFIPNGFDSQKFRLTIPVEMKEKNLVSMLYHVNVRKDTSVGIKAVELAKEQVPELRLVMFGAYPKPGNLPDWITYYRNPSMEKHLEINNRAAVYVGCSRIEGWGLTVGEAMMCGQAVACTDNDGYREMATDDVNALVTPVGDAEALAASIVRLVTDDQLRYRIANKGLETIKDFDIEKSYTMFRDYITLGQ